MKVHNMFSKAFSRAYYALFPLRGKPLIKKGKLVYALNMENGSNWWNEAIGYIIYPESFKDGNGDGIGDLRGIIEKLDYLKELGVNLLWICPIFASPMDDNGYDVSDYYHINPRFGTDEDFIVLLKEAHQRNIRIVMDLVLNHTSDEHPWFQRALHDENAPEHDYYIFKKGRYVDGKLMPPTNWSSFFTSSVWERVPGTDEFYFHTFSRKMPDVNWNNPSLRKEYFKIANYWVEKGVDGFRLDAVAHLGKDLSWSDSTLPVGKDGTVLDTSKFSNRPEVFSYLKELRASFLGKPVLLIGEVGGEIQPEQGRLLADREKGTLNLLFNFDTVWNNGNFGSIGKKDEEIKTDVLLLKHNFMRWYEACHENCDMPLYWCNHDHPRVLSQYGSLKYRNESAKMLANTLLFFYGTPFLHYGEEIGLANLLEAPLESFTMDVGTKDSLSSFRREGYSDQEILNFFRRAARMNGRSIMQWNHDENAGFSKTLPRMPLGFDYKEGFDVQDEMEDPYSILNFYQYAINLRRDPFINDLVLRAPLEIVDWNHPDVLSYLHRGNDTRLMVISNFRPYEVYFTFDYQIADILLQNYDGVILKDHVFTLRPFETLLLRLR